MIGTLLTAAFVLSVAAFGFGLSGRTMCNGKCRRHAIDPRCPLHGKGGKA